MRRRLTLATTTIVAATAVWLAMGSDAQTQSEELEPRQVRVVWMEDPATQALVSWTTTARGTDHVLHADVQPRGGTLADYAIQVDVENNGAYYDDADGPYFHHALLTDLEPDTEYHFVVETDGNASRELYFRTAHDDDRAFKLLYGGDSRTGRDDRQAMNRRIAALHENDAEILALVHGGDYIDWANTWWQWSNWLDDHELTIGSDGRVLPIVPAKGNHEGRGVVYNDVFGQPGGSDDINYFATQLGSVSLVNLDTEVSMAGDQRDWLETQLEEGRASRWLVVNYHRPAFPAVKSASGAREHWVPLFEQYDVDLVCESDGHTLKRTPPIRNEQIDFTGVTYVGEGGLGVPQRTPSKDRWYLQSPGMAASAHHVQILEFGEDLLRYSAVLESGDIADEITILPHEERVAQMFTAVLADARSPQHVEVVMNAPLDPASLDSLSAEFSPNLEVTGVEPGSVVDDVLAFVNEATEEELDDDAALDARAAMNIVEYRLGDDGEADTDDDQFFTTWGQLDGISYVGKSALGRLVEYTRGMYPNPRNVVTISVDGLEQGPTYQLLLSDVTSQAGQTIAAGTTLSFSWTDDSPADQINPHESTEESTCATASSGPSTAGLWFFMLLIVTRTRRWTDIFYRKS